MAASTLISIEEYLRTSYEPDCDYVDGEVRERNVGLRPHAEMLTQIGVRLYQMQRHGDTLALMTMRVRVSPTRVLVPDICLAYRTPYEDMIETPPLLVVEILDPADRFGAMVDRVSDFLQMGIKHIWLIDPRNRRGYIASSRGFEVPRNGIFAIAGTSISIDLAEVFDEIDEP